MVGQETKFVIHTRTDENKDRKYGMDEWKIKAKKVKEGEAKFLEVGIEDKGNGKY